MTTHGQGAVLVAPVFAQPHGSGHPLLQVANAARNRQAGGHWFEPSTAHQKAPHRGFFVALTCNNRHEPALPQGSVGQCERARSGDDATAGLIAAPRTRWRAPFVLIGGHWRSTQPGSTVSYRWGSVFVADAVWLVGGGTVGRPGGLSRGSGVAVRVWRWVGGHAAAQAGWSRVWSVGCFRRVQLAAGSARICLSASR